MFPFLGSVVFFYLAKDLAMLQRVLASVHGWFALSIVPFSALMATSYPNVKASIGFPVVLFLGCVSGVSMFMLVDHH